MGLNFGREVFPPFNPTAHQSRATMLLPMSPKGHRCLSILNFEVYNFMENQIYDWNIEVQARLLRVHT